MTKTRLTARSLWWIPLAALLIWTPGSLKAGEESLVLEGEELAVTQEAIPPLEVQLANSNVEEELPGAWWDCYFTCPGQAQTGLFACTSFLMADCCAVVARYCDVTFSWCENGSVGIPCP